MSTVQIQNATKKSSVSEADQSQLVGMIAVLVSCVSSGFAGVYFEKILKGKAYEKELNGLVRVGGGLVLRSYIHYFIRFLKV